MKLLKVGREPQKVEKHCSKLDGSLPANPENDRRIANAVTLKSTSCLP